jgi:glycosyltransferase involved in cell wall biosynthesis
MLTPDQFWSVPMPTYGEIRLSLALPGTVASRIEAISPDAIHIATEGPLGYLARLYCMRNGQPFTTCYHTRFPEYIAARVPVPVAWTYALLRRFHNAADATLVATGALRDEMAEHGFTKLKIWRRGIDLALFQNGERKETGLARPLALYVGRVSVEKNIEAFLALDLPGVKMVVGDGPARAELARKYPQVRFMGLGFGHGVGLCQEGAMARARSGADAAAILDAYFFGVRLDVWPTAGFPVPPPSSASLPPSAPAEGPAAGIRPGG